MKDYVTRAFAGVRKLLSTELNTLCGSSQSDPFCVSNKCRTGTVKDVANTFCESMHIKREGLTSSRRLCQNIHSVASTMSRLRDAQKDGPHVPISTPHAASTYI